MREVRTADTVEGQFCWRRATMTIRDPEGIRYRSCALCYWVSVKATKNPWNDLRGCNGQRQTMSDQFDKYINREPLTRELAEIKAGRDPDAPPELVRPLIEAASRDVTMPLTDADRLDLKDFREHPGWTVFVRLQKRTIAIHEKTAIVMSKDSPLANAVAVAQEWERINLFERAIIELTGLVDAEILKLNKTEGTKQ